MSTNTYKPSEFPAFAVTVDVVVLTMANGRLHVLLVQRGVDPFAGMWAIPGGFKRPEETLAYGDPGRDPRMNVVTVAYVAVIRDIGTPAASTDAAAAALIPVDEVVSGQVELAFDHTTILGDAADRVRTDLELTGTATAFLPPAFTLAELRSVYEAVWNVRFDAANFRKRVLAEDGWVIPTGRRAQPGAAGGKPAELFRAGRRWKHGSPVRRRRAAS